MKQFLYMDTDIVNSIIAQAEKGLITQQSSESESEDKKEYGNEKTIKGVANGKGTFLKIVQAQAEVEGGVSLTNTKEQSTSSRDIIEKILHDAAFDIAYSYIRPIIVFPDNQEYDEPGKYIEIKRVYSFVDFKYLERLFSKEGIIEYVKKSSAEQIEAMAGQTIESYNRETQRKSGSNVKKEIQKAISDSNKQYDEMASMISAFRSFIPYDRLLISDDGYLIPLDEKYFRVDPTNLGFRYGGEIICVGMVTNIIGDDCNPEDFQNPFVTLQHTVNETLRNMLPTVNKNLFVIHPIAVYYGE